MAAGGVALAGAGVAMNKKKRNGKTDLEKENQKITYDDLEKLYNDGQIINPHDYEDDLELFAKAWVLSKKQQEKLQEPANVKGRRR